MSHKELWVFPVSSTSINSRVELVKHGTEAVLSFDFFDEDKDDEVFNGAILFKNTLLHIRDSYDTLIEVDDSDWLREIMELNEEAFIFWENLKHFMIFLDGYGLYEFISTDFEISEFNKGALKKRV
jgi:hypothetical protein